MARFHDAAHVRGAGQDTKYYVKGNMVKECRRHESLGSTPFQNVAVKLSLWRHCPLTTVQYCSTPRKVSRTYTEQCLHTIFVYSHVIQGSAIAQLALLM